MALPSLSLYDTPSALDKAFGGLSSASSTTSQMQKNQPYPGKTAGGAIMNAAGGGLAGAQLASAIPALGMTGPIGLGVGAGIGALAYFLS